MAALADPAEVESGRRQLQSDIASGRIVQVMEDFRRDLGDYLFIVCMDMEGRVRIDS